MKKIPVFLMICVMSLSFCSCDFNRLLNRDPEPVSVTPSPYELLDEAIAELGNVNVSISYRSSLIKAEALLSAMSDSEQNLVKNKDNLKVYRSEYNRLVRETADELDAKVTDLLQEKIYYTKDLESKIKNCSNSNPDVTMSMKQAEAYSKYCEEFEKRKDDRKHSCSKTQTCSGCDGYGTFVVTENYGDRNTYVYTCKVCNGSGTVTCKKCGGHGYYYTYETPPKNEPVTTEPVDEPSRDPLIFTAAKDSLSDLIPGDTVIMGTYEQDNKTYIGPEPLEWEVIEVKDGKALITTKNVIEKKNTFELCQWLNQDFYKGFFSDDERKIIALSDVWVGDCDSFGKYNLRNHFFILSREQVLKMYPKSSKYELHNIIHNQFTEYVKAISRGSDELLLLPSQAPDMYDFYRLAYNLSDGTITVDNSHIKKDILWDYMYPIKPACWIYINDSIPDKSDGKTNENTVNFKEIKKGDTILMGDAGQYGQTDFDTDKIEWTVLDVKDGKALLLSRFVLFEDYYNNKYYYNTLSKKGDIVTWSNSYIREKLNGEFYSKIFSDSEKRRIISSELTNADNPEYGTSGGKNTTDKIFLIDVFDAQRYFSSEDSLRAFTSWYLRTPGGSINNASYIDRNGVLQIYGESVNDFGNWTNTNGIRPAMWISLD